MEIIYVLMALFTPVLALIGIVDAVKTEDRVWQAAGRSRLGAIALLVFVPLVGAGIYLLKINPELAAYKEAQRSEVLTPQ